MSYNCGCSWHQRCINRYTCTWCSSSENKDTRLKKRSGRCSAQYNNCGPFVLIYRRFFRSNELQRSMLICFNTEVYTGSTNHIQTKYKHI